MNMICVTPIICCHGLHIHVLRRIQEQKHRPRQVPSEFCLGTRNHAIAERFFPWDVARGLARFFLGSGNRVIFPGQALHQTCRIHLITSGGMLAVASDFVRSSLIQSEAGRRLVLSHLSSYVVPPSQFIGKTVSEGAEDKTINLAERCCCKELDFGNRVAGLHQACGVHLYPLEIDGLPS